MNLIDRIGSWLQRNVWDLFRGKKPDPKPEPIVTPTNSAPAIVTAPSGLLPGLCGRPAIVATPTGYVVAHDSTTGTVITVHHLRPDLSIEATATIDVRSVVPKVACVFNPSLAVFTDGTVALTAWIWANNIPHMNPHVWLSREAGKWQAVKLFDTTHPKEWHPCSLAPWPIGPAISWFGLGNRHEHIYPLGEIASAVTVPSPKGGGEKEARCYDSKGLLHLANSGCQASGGSWYKLLGNRSTPVIWADYAAYGSKLGKGNMGTDTHDHCSLCVSGGAAYMFAAYRGVIFNAHNGNRLLCDPSNLPIIDKDGHSGAAYGKYPLSCAALPDGSAVVSYCRNRHIFIARVKGGDKLSITSGPDGTMSAFVVEGDKAVMAYCNGAAMAVRRVTI